MLFYARMKSVRKDYYLERLRIRECAEEVLLDYRPLLEEKGFQVQNFLSGETVYADRRGLRFLLGQIISNAIKYSKEKPVLELSGFQEEGRWALSIRDNGAGVPAIFHIYLKKDLREMSAEEEKRPPVWGCTWRKESREK